jgi:two-component system nitrogen regulation response regulator GlnG
MAATPRDRRPLGVTTVTPEEPAPRQAATCVALTVAFHPDLARVGEMAILPAAGPLGLSRAEPNFARPGRDDSKPLEDVHLSRRPLMLEIVAGGALRCEPAPDHVVHLDGERLSGTRVVPADALGRGAVLMLSQTVVLVIHRSRVPVLPSSLKLVGDSDAIESVRGAIRRVADLDVPVLIRGETGTGKEMVARAIADASPRAGGPYLAINMAAITSSTAASELFGHARGAFTGAVDAHEGYFGEADGGTLFLDEIGLVPADVQAMLLRALETGEIQPLGGRKRRQVNVRLLAATDANLEQAVAAGRFSEALLQRLAGFEVRLPPLRERREDIGRLFAHFLREELKAIGEEKVLATPDLGASSWVPASFVDRLVRAPWPGNVRQLRNVVRQLAIASRGEPRARTEGVLDRLVHPGTGPRTDTSAFTAPPASATSTTATPPGAAERGARAPSSISDDELVKALERNQWRTSATAAELGISRTTLYVLIDRSTRIRKAANVPEAELRALQEKCGGDLDEMSRVLKVSRRGLQLRLRQVLGR